MLVTLLRRFFKLAIALFCIWHIAAIGIYSLYSVEGYPILEWLDSKRTHVRPYVLATSQWQRWNLFSPDPLRRVIEMDFELYQDDEWQLFKILNHDHVSFWQRAPELKTMRRMEEEKMNPLKERYVQDVCRTMKIPPGTRIKLSKRWFVIPRHDKTKSTEWWNSWQPDWYNDELLQATCNDFS